MITLKSFSFSINNTYAIYEHYLIAWIPQTQNLYDDNLEYLSSTPISFSNFGLKIKYIFCNTDVCHAITEGGSIYSWGNDIDQKGLLALGDNIFKVKIPTLNKNLSSLNIKYISLSETHGAGIDYNGNLYTWGDDSFGQCGLNKNNNENNKGNNNINNHAYNSLNKICFIPKKVVLNSTFIVNKIQCGKFYTAGITNEGTVFKFGLINYKSKNNVYNASKKNSSIIFLNIKNNDDSNFDEINNDRVTDIFCGEELLTFINQKGELFIYTELQGLYKVKLNSDNQENTKINLFEDNRKNNFSIDKVKFIDRTFYAISKNNSMIYEFINYSYKNRDFDLFDYVQNEYDVNENSIIEMISQPYYVKVIFFKIKCSDYHMRNFEEGEEKLFFKRKYNPDSKDFLITSNNINNNFYNTNDSVNSLNSNITNNLSSMSKISKISNMLGNLLDRKIDDIINKTKIYYNAEGNAFLLGKKRIELIKIDYENNEGVNFLENELISEILNNNNVSNLTSNILNIPINENFKERNRGRRNLFDEEKNRANSTSKSSLYHGLSSNKNENNNNINSDNNDKNNENNFRGFSSGHINNGNNYENEIINNNDEQSKKIKEKMDNLKKKFQDNIKQNINNSNKNKEILINNLKNINDKIDESPERKENKILDKFKNEIEKEKELNEKNKILREEQDKIVKEIKKEINNNKKPNYNNLKSNLKRKSDQFYDDDTLNSKTNSEKKENINNLKLKRIKDLEGNYPENKNLNDEHSLNNNETNLFGPDENNINSNNKLKSEKKRNTNKKSNDNLDDDEINNEKRIKNKNSKGFLNENDDKDELNNKKNELKNKKGKNNNDEESDEEINKNNNKNLILKLSDDEESNEESYKNNNKK